MRFNPLATYWNLYSRV